MIEVDDITEPCLRPYSSQHATCNMSTTVVLNMVIIISTRATRNLIGQPIVSALTTYYVSLHHQLAPRQAAKAIAMHHIKWVAVERVRLQQLPTTPIQLQATYTLDTHTMSVKDPITGGSGIGFDFSNHARNQHLGARMGGLPKGMSNMLHPSTFLLPLQAS